VQTKYLDRGEGRLAYTDYGGDGPLVLMLPGMGALRSEYRFLAPGLADEGYHAVAADLRGHGESSARWTVYDVPSVGRDVLALVDYLDARRGGAHLIGTSFAPAALVWAAAEKPEVVRSLTLIAPFVRTAKLNPVMAAAYALMTTGPWRVAAWGLYYGMMYPTRKPADFRQYVDALKRNMAQPGRFEAAMALANSSRQPSEERLKRVKAPVLVVMGTKDPDFPHPEAEARYVAEQTGGRMALIEGAGHYPQTEMPEKTGDLVIDFLGEADQAWATAPATGR
jgi:pimeloyl-ACP methyl ester carboxylesterase